MAKAVFKAREFTVKAKGSKEFVSEEMVRAKLFAARKKKEAESMSVFAAVIKPEKSGTEEQITPTDQVENGVEHEVVAIYDNAGIPSFMHRFRKNYSVEVIKSIRHLLLEEKSTIRFIFQFTRTARSTVNHIAFHTRNLGQTLRMMKQQRFASLKVKAGT